MTKIKAIWFPWTKEIVATPLGHWKNKSNLEIRKTGETGLPQRLVAFFKKSNCYSVAASCPAEICSQCCYLSHSFKKPGTLFNILTVCNDKGWGWLYCQRFMSQRSRSTCLSVFKLLQNSLDFFLLHLCFSFLETRTCSGWIQERNLKDLSSSELYGKAALE